MRHFVAYHNTSKMGYEYRPGTSQRVVSNKPVSHLLNNVVWVVTYNQYRGDREYVLASTFQVTEFGDENGGSFKHYVSGKGHSFKPQREIGTSKWFPALLKATGNFAFGLQEIRDPKVLRGMIEIARGDGCDQYDS